MNNISSTGIDSSSIGNNISSTVSDSSSIGNNISSTGSDISSIVIPRLTSDPANEFFG